MNRIFLIGNIASDPEAHTTQSGISQSAFRIAVQRKYSNRDGVREADFFPVVAWRQTADFCNKYLTKGRKVAVEGTLQTRSYEARDGSKRYVTEVIADSVEALTKAEDSPREAEKPEQGDFVEVEDDSDLPF